jgi:HK97 family phage prohead protease
MTKKKVKLSDHTVNSYDFIVLTAGGDFDRFNKNPVFLFDHSTRMLIGRIEDLEVIGEEIWGVPVFNSKNELAAEKEQEYNDGFIRGFSLGIEPREFEYGQNPLFGDKLVLTKWELSEVSLCAIPSNKNAVKLYKDGQPMADEEIGNIKLSLHNQKSNMKNRAQLVAKLKLAADATDEQILEAVETLQNNLKQSNDALTLAKTESETALKQAKKTRIELMVDTAIASGKLSKEQRDTYIELGEANEDAAKKAIDGMKPSIKPIELTKDKGSEHKAVKGKEDWTYDDWATKDSKGLALMKKDNREQFDTLLNAAKEAKKRA